MNSFGKLFAILLVSSSIQVILGKSIFDFVNAGFIESGLSNSADGVLNDVLKESRHVKEKITKESVKIMKKSNNDEKVTSVVEDAKTEAFEALDSLEEEITNSIEDLKENLKESLQDKTTFAELWPVKKEFKIKLNQTKSEAKTNIKVIYKTFNQTVKHLN